MGLRAGAQWRHAVRTPRIRSFVARLAGLLGCMAAMSAAIAPGAGAANRIYWANYNINGLAYWSLDDSGGANINTLGATVDGPMGMALDPAHGRIYWTNWGSDSVSGTGLGTTISYANLDGSGGGGTLPITAGFVNGPHGLAIDPVAGKLYWPNFGSDTISYANLDGSGAANLNTTGAMVDGPRGVTVDPAAGKIYWANYADGFGTTISWGKPRRDRGRRLHDRLGNGGRAGGHRSRSPTAARSGGAITAARGTGLRSPAPTSQMAPTRLISRRRGCPPNGCTELRLTPPRTRSSGRTMAPTRFRGPIPTAAPPVKFRSSIRRRRSSARCCRRCCTSPWEFRGPRPSAARRRSARP